MCERITTKQAVDYLKMRLENVEYPLATRQQQVFIVAIESIEELWQYRSLGYTPQELQQIINNTFNADLEKEALVG